MHCKRNLPVLAQRHYHVGWTQGVQSLPILRNERGSKRNAGTDSKISGGNGNEMTQNEMVLHHLKAYGSITPKEAMDLYAVMRL